MSNFRDFLFDRGRSRRYALALAMTGVRMGERLLMVGDDAPLAAQLAAKVGLTGRSVVVVGSEAAAARVTAAAAEAGVLLEDVRVGALPALPVDDGAFDAAVVDAGPTFLTALDGPGRLDLARSLARSLRPAGRLIVVEGQPRSAFALFRGGARHAVPLRAFRAAGGATTLLEAAGLRPVRLLADREGQRFTEGLKRT
jgi:SAM-dependent methyltransferase